MFNKYNNGDSTPLFFKVFFGFILTFIVMVFAAIITFYVLGGRYVLSGKAKKDLNSEVRDLSKSWKDRD